MAAAPLPPQLVEHIPAMPDRYTVQMVAVTMVVLLLPVFLRTCRNVKTGARPAVEPQMSVEGLPAVLRALLQEALPSALKETVPGLLQETLGARDQVDSPPSLIESLREVLPDLLRDLMKETFPAQESPAAHHVADAASVTLAVDTVKEVVNEALETKWKMLRQAVQADMEQSLKKNSDAMTKQQGDRHKDLQKTLDALKQQLEVVGQSVAQAGKTEQVRFQTLDGAVRGRVEVMETNVKSRIDLLNNDLNNKMTNFDTAQARLEVYMAKLEGLTATLEGMPKKLSEKMEVGKLEGVVSKLESLPKKIADSSERIEMKTDMVRDGANSVNKLMGEVQQAGRDHAGLARRNTASMESLQSAVASMGAALGQPPPDSPGVKEVTDLVKDIGAQTANIAEAMTELSREVRDKSNAASSKQPAPSVQTPDPVQQAGGGTTLNQMPRGMPAVIDLSSRIPAARHSQPRNVTWATVTLSSGRQVLVPEDDVLGLQPGPFMNVR